jgi:uncharacterized protein (DUF885 family)
MTVLKSLLLMSFSIVSAAAQPPTLDAAIADVTHQPQTAYEKKCQTLVKGKSKKSESARLKEIFDFQWNYWMTTYPEWATFVGFPGQDDRWTDNSFKAIAVRRREQQCPVTLIKSVNRAKLSQTDALNYDLFRRRMEMSIEELRFKGDYLVMTQLDGFQQDLARMLTMMPKENEAQMKSILARLKGVPAVVQQSQALLQAGLAQKVTAPKITLRDVPAQIQAMIQDDPLKSPLLESFKDRPDTVSEAAWSKIRTQAIDDYIKEIRPALVAFHAFVKDTYIPGARMTIAWKDLPNGQAWYAFRARSTTTTDMTPQQIHDLGLKEVARIRDAMEKVKAEAKFKGTLDEFLTFLRTDKQFYYTNADELLAGYRDIAKRAEPELTKLFGLLPRMPYGIKAVPAYSEKSQPAAYYEGGSSTRAGYFFANTYDLPSRPKWDMETLTLHEAVPGHHLQTALAKEMEEAPEFRRYDGYTAYMEGWGLYAESLGYEMGFYKNPYSNFGHLAADMLRAARLVVDTGMHHLGWTRQQAIDYMKKNTAEIDHDITVEIDRYIVWASQALGYKVGQLKIKQLRENATKELGEHFDIRGFHDTVLGTGAVPLDILEKEVARWVREQKQVQKAKKI